MLETEDISQIEKKVRDIFSLRTKSLDQLGSVGAFFHIKRRQVTLTQFRHCLGNQTDSKVYFSGKWLFYDKKISICIQIVIF
jgi:hypothetical protein